MILTAWLCLGCTSSGQGKNWSSYLPLGVIAVVSNSNIYWEDEEPSSSARPSKRATPEKTKVSSAQELISDAEAILQQSFIDAGISDLISRDQILEAQTYKSAPISRFWKGKGYVTADGYLPVNYRDKKFAADIAQEAGVQGGVYLLFDFSRAMASGIGKSGHFRVQVNMQVIIVDSQGVIRYRKNRFISSEDRIPVSFRAYNQEEMMDVFRTVIANACYLFIQDFAASNFLELEY
jgi:hypothetical protein